MRLEIRSAATGKLILPEIKNPFATVQEGSTVFLRATSEHPSYDVRIVKVVRYEEQGNVAQAWVKWEGLPEDLAEDSINVTGWTRMSDPEPSKQVA